MVRFSNLAEHLGNLAVNGAITPYNSVAAISELRITCPLECLQV